MERRWREEGLDEYEDEDGEGYGYDEEEEEEEEELEEHKPTQEELDYLSRREKLKERIRQKLRKENGSASRAGASVDRKKPAANTEFGSFFGPSQPIIARRVIEERHSMRETEHIRAKDTSSNSVVRRAPSTNGEGRTHSHQQRPKVVNEFKAKAQTLKDIRDYSFLFSDDADLPAPSKEPPPRNPLTPLSDSRPSQASPRTNAAMNKHPAGLSGGSEMKKTAATSQNIQSKVSLSKVPSLDRSKQSSSAPRNLPNGSAGRGPARPPLQKSAPTSAHQSAGLKKPLGTALNKSVNLDRNPSVAKAPPQKHYSEQRREPRGLPKAKPMGKQPMPSSRPHQPISSKPQQMVSSSKHKQPIPSPKPQLPKPSKQIAQQRQSHLKRKPSQYSDEENGATAISSMIRQMFRYNPNRYNGVDEDDSDMEANFDDIMREEKRSEKIARQEDEEQLRLIEEEERRERMRKQAKKRKIG